MINESMAAIGRSRSCIRELFEYGNQQAAKVGRENVYDFSLGNPSIPAPAEVDEAIISAVRDLDSISVHGYTSAAGNPALREMVTADLNKRYGTNLSSFNIFFTCGAAPSIVSVVKALAVDGAEIVTQAPFFPEYRVFAEKAGANLVVCPPAEGLEIDLEAFRSLLGPNTRAVIVNSPNNPSGVVYAEETVRALAAILEEAERRFGVTIYLISDEPYRALLFDGKQATCFPRYYADTVVCYSYSKALSLPGERIGYIAVSPRAAEKTELYLAVCGAGRALGYVCAPALFQRLVKACDGMTADVDVYRTNRDILYGALTEMGFTCAYPSGAFYLFVKAPSGNANEFSEAAKALDILVVPSDSFGCEGYVRIAYCVSTEQIRRSLPAFRALAAKTL